MVHTTMFDSNWNGPSACSCFLLGIERLRLKNGKPSYLRNQWWKLQFFLLSFEGLLRWYHWDHGKQVSGRGRCLESMEAQTVNSPNRLMRWYLRLKCWLCLHFTFQQHKGDAVHNNKYNIIDHYEKTYLRSVPRRNHQENETARIFFTWNKRLV